MRKYFIAVAFGALQLGFAQTYLSNKAHEIIVYNSGISSLEKRLEMIEGARHTIDVEYFLFNPHEDSARLIVQALWKKALSGVQVNLLIDGMGLYLKFDPQLVAEFARVPNKKFQIKLFNKSFMLKQQRNHRKHLIIDGREVITGGRNLEDKYFDMDPRYNFMDRDVWVKGPIVQSVKHSFDLIWNDTSIAAPAPVGKLLEHIKVPNLQMTGGGGRGTWNHAERSRVKKQLEQAKAARRMITTNQEDIKIRKEIAYWAEIQSDLLGKFNGPVAFVTDFNYRGIFNHLKKNKVIWDEIIKSVSRVNETLDVESPYMVLTRDSFDLLRKLKSRAEPNGEIHAVAMTNGPKSTDNTLTSTTYFGLSDDLAEAGAIITVYNGDVPKYLKDKIPHRARNAKWGTHAKTMVFDQRRTAIGTFNLDPRSKNLNLESIMYFPDNPNLAGFVISDINKRKEQSFEFFVIDKNGKATQKFSDCHDLDFSDCFMMRVQRPFGFILKRLL